MNNITNKFLGDKFIPEIHLRQHGFTYADHYKNIRIQKFKEIGYLRHIYQKELHKAYFQQDRAQGAYKDISRKIAFSKVLSVKAFAIASNTQYNGYLRGLSSMVNKFYERKSRDTATYIVTGIVSEYEQLSNELHKTITKIFEKRKVSSSLQDNIWDVDFRNAKVAPLKYEKGIIITNAFLKFLS